MVSKGTFPGCWIRCIRRVYCLHAVTATHRTPSMEHIHDMQTEHTCQMPLCAHRSTRARAHKLKRTASSAISPPSLEDATIIQTLKLNGRHEHRCFLCMSTSHRWPDCNKLSRLSRSPSDDRSNQEPHVAWIERKQSSPKRGNERGPR